MDRISPASFPPGFIDDELAMRAALSDRRDIIDRDVICYYQDATDPSVWHESKLKLFDTVEVFGAPALVLGPAEGRTHFHAACQHPDLGLMLGPYTLGDVTDRLPYDESEPGPHFPIIPAPSEPEP